MSSTTPWKDERWLPGVLNRNQIIALKNAYLLMDIDESTLGWDASALDLHLTSEGYKMIKGSIKPFNKSYKEILLDTSYAEPLPKGDDSFLLEKETCYIFKIKERLHHCIKSSPIYGQATAKSTFGRVDVIARLIVDGMKEYENFDPTEVDSGDMFIEITPITFNVKVRKGDSISQLRFFFGEIENSIIQDKDFIKSILHIPDGVFNDGTLSVDISNVFLNDGTPAAAFQAKEKVLTPIELWKKPEPERYPQNDFWNAIPSDEKDGLKSIQIKENKFYILRSKERIALTDGVCIYCRAMDETLGEMRIHYAGFVHPCFGDERDDHKIGTPLIFEVRGHNVKILLTHNEILARLFFYRMSERAIPDSSAKKVSYNDQELNLSTLFQKNWN